MGLAVELFEGVVFEGVEVFGVVAVAFGFCLAEVSPVVLEV